jgi:hypothetical protein
MLGHIVVYSEKRKVSLQNTRAVSTVGGNCSSLFRGLDILSLEALEAALGHGDVRDEGVQLVHRVFVLVAHARQADAHPAHRMRI